MTETPASPNPAPASTPAPAPSVPKPAVPVAAPKPAATPGAAAAKPAVPAAAAKPPAPPPPPPVGKRVLFVMPPEGFQAEEFRSSLSSLRRHGMYCKVASTTTEKVVGGIDYYLPDMTLDKIDLASWDALVFLGGDGAVKFAENSQAVALARSAHQAGKLVAAIGAGSILLGKAGLLSGRRATGEPSVKAALEAAGAKFTGAQVEPQWLHGNPHKIVTAADSGASHRFGQRIVRDLGF